MSNPDFEKFDSLFERIDIMAVSDDDGMPQRELFGRQSSTRSTPKVGKLFFTLFSSEVKSEITDKALYPPSITAFGVPKVQQLHIKKHELEIGPNVDARRQKKAVKKLGKLEKLFSQYERITTP